MPYQAPVKDMLFVLNHLAGLPAVAALPGFEEATPDTAQAVLEEAAHFAGEVLAPLNQPADREPGAWRDGAVTTAPGFKQAFRQYAEAGWQGMNHPPNTAARAARPAGRGHLGNAECRQPVVLAVSAADQRRHRGAADRRLGRAARALHRPDDLRQVDWHHEPDRAAGRLGPGPAALARRTARRRQLPHLRHQDLHHLRRA